MKLVVSLTVVQDWVNSFQCFIYTRHWQCVHSFNFVNLPTINYITFSWPLWLDYITLFFRIDSAACPLHELSSREGGRLIVSISPVFISWCITVVNFSPSTTFWNSCLSSLGVSGSSDFSPHILFPSTCPHSEDLLHIISQTSIYLLIYQSSWMPNVHWVFFTLPFDWELNSLNIKIVQFLNSWYRQY